MGSIHQLCKGSRRAVLFDLERVYLKNYLTLFPGILSVGAKSYKIVKARPGPIVFSMELFLASEMAKIKKKITGMK